MLNESQQRPSETASHSRSEEITERAKTELGLEFSHRESSFGRVFTFTRPEITYEELLSGINRIGSSRFEVSLISPDLINQQVMKEQPTDPSPVVIIPVITNSDWVTSKKSFLATNQMKRPHMGDVALLCALFRMQQGFTDRAGRQLPMNRVGSQEDNGDALEGRWVETAHGVLTAGVDGVKIERSPRATGKNVHVAGQLTSGHVFDGLRYPMPGRSMS